MLPVPVLELCKCVRLRGAAEEDQRLRADPSCFSIRDNIVIYSPLPLVMDHARALLHADQLLALSKPHSLDPVSPGSEGCS